MEINKEKDSENVEIEKKYLLGIKNIDELERIGAVANISECEVHCIEQAYLCTEPVVRVRRQDNEYYLTYKGKGFMIRQEYNLPLTEEAYNHLLKKADGIVITKKRYMIPYKEYTIELDCFEGEYEGLLLAEVEFKNKKEAEEFEKPDWFLEDVTYEAKYHNSVMSAKKF